MISENNIHERKRGPITPWRVELPASGSRWLVLTILAAEELLLRGNYGFKD